MGVRLWFVFCYVWCDLLWYIWHWKVLQKWKCFEIQNKPHGLRKSTMSKSIVLKMWLKLQNIYETLGFWCHVLTPDGWVADSLQWLSGAKAAKHTFEEGPGRLSIGRVSNGSPLSLRGRYMMPGPTPTSAQWWDQDRCQLPSSSNGSDGTWVRMAHPPYDQLMALFVLGGEDGPSRRTLAQIFKSSTWGSIF